MATSSLVTINGRPLFVESTGSNPALPLLVALHGLGGSTNLFPIASWLADKFNVVRFDFEGAGKSPYTEGAKWEITDLVEDVKAVAEALGRGGEAIHLFGHSLGSAVNTSLLCHDETSSSHSFRRSRYTSPLPTPSSLLPSPSRALESLEPETQKV
jgi:pimeloyl-ACP methyl ester carboxylesterase